MTAKFGLNKLQTSL